MRSSYPWLWFVIGKGGDWDENEKGLMQVCFYYALLRLASAIQPCFLVSLVMFLS